MVIINEIAKGKIKKQKIKDEKTNAEILFEIE